jgi:ribosomal protein L7/L12
MSNKIDEIIEKLKEINLLEASELVKKILRFNKKTKKDIL